MPGRLDGACDDAELLTGAARREHPAGPQKYVRLLRLVSAVLSLLRNGGGLSKMRHLVCHQRCLLH